MQNLNSEARMRLTRRSLKFVTLASVVLGAVLLTTRLFSIPGFSDEDGKMRVAFPYREAITQYDPAAITLAPQYILLETMYSPLVEMDNNGRVVEGIARKFEWVGDEAHFTLRDDLKTADNISITADDAALSLKRLLIISGNTHGNLKDLLCAHQELTKLSDACDGIEVRGNTLTLKPGKKKTFLFDMLTAIDFAVIPKDSIDHESLKIIDYRNTSGPYFLLKDDGEGKMVLKANPMHYHFSQVPEKRIAQEITLVPSDPKNPLSSLEMIKSNKVDVITTIDATRSEDILAFVKGKESEYQLHQTQNIRTTLLAFTQKGLQKFSPARRIEIGKRVRAAFNAYARTVEGYAPTEQFFPEFGDGGLTKAQVEDLRKVFSSSSDESFDGTGLRVHLVRVGRKPLFEKILSSVLPGIEVIEGRNPNFVDYSANPDEMPEMFISAPDTGFSEDIGLISYSLNAGYSPLDKDGRKAFLADYAEESDKAKRLTKLRTLQFRTLTEPVVIPLATSAYVAIAKSKWNLNLSKYCANNPLWQITLR